MSQELIYTSAPRGLKPGSRGFCTVISSEGMAQNLAEQLEALSGYRHVFGPHDAQSHLNPILWSHLKLTVGGRPYHVLSRIADAGLDYTNRTNKFAHHVALDRGETVPAGPAWVLSQPGFMETAWDGTPRIVPAGRRPARADVGPAACTAWQAATGDAGWGGALAETALANRPAVIVYRPGTSVLPLVAESLALVPPDRRWDVTFCTYFTRLPPGVTCLWRFVIDGTPEASTARTPQSLVINLAAAARAPDSPWTEAARTGRIPPGLWPAAEPQVVLPVNRTGDVAELERELAAEAQRSRPDRSASRVPPPRSTEPVSFGVAPPAIRSLGIPQPVGRAPDSGRFAPGAWRPKRRPWLVAAVVLLAMAGLSAGVFMSLPDNVRSRLAGGLAAQPDRNVPAPPNPNGVSEKAEPPPVVPTEATATAVATGTADHPSTAGTAPVEATGAPPGTAATTPTAAAGPAATPTAAPPAPSTAAAEVSSTGATPNAPSTSPSPPADPPKPPAEPKFHYLGSKVGDKSEVIFEAQGAPPTKWVLKQPNAPRSSLGSLGGGVSDFDTYAIELNPEDRTLRGFQSKFDPLDLRMCIVDYDGTLHQFFEPVRYGPASLALIKPDGTTLQDGELRPAHDLQSPPFQGMLSTNITTLDNRIQFKNVELSPPTQPNGEPTFEVTIKPLGDWLLIRFHQPLPKDVTSGELIPLCLLARAHIGSDGAPSVKLFHAIDAPEWLLTLVRKTDALSTLVEDASKITPQLQPGESLYVTTLRAQKDTLIKCANALNFIKPHVASNALRQFGDVNPEYRELAARLRRPGWNPFVKGVNEGAFEDTKIQAILDCIDRRPSKDPQLNECKTALEEFRDHTHRLRLKYVGDSLTLVFGHASKWRLDFDLVVPDDEGKAELLVATTRDQTARPVHVIPWSPKP